MQIRNSPPALSEPPVSGLRPTEPAGLGKQLRKQLRARRVMLVASLGFLLLSLWFLERGGLPLLPSAGSLKRTSLVSVAACTVLTVLMLIVRAYRFRYLSDPLAKLPLREIMAANFVFFAANFALPLRLGEVVRPALLRRPGRLSGWQVLGIVGAERIIDGLLGSLVLVISLAWAVSPPGLQLDPVASLVRPSAYLSALLFGGGFVALLAFYFARSWARRTIVVTLGTASARLGMWVANKVERLAEGLEFFSRPRSAWKFTVSSLIYWGLSVLSVWVLLIGSGIHASFAQAGVVLGVLTLGLLVPGAPGFFGIFQMSAYAGLSLYLAPQLVRDSGSVFVFWLYVIQFTVSLVPAVWAIPVSSRTLAAATLPVAQSATSQESDRPEV